MRAPGRHGVGCDGRRAPRRVRSRRCRTDGPISAGVTGDATPVCGRRPAEPVPLRFVGGCMLRTTTTADRGYGQPGKRQALGRRDGLMLSSARRDRRARRPARTMEIADRAGNEALAGHLRSTSVLARSHSRFRCGHVSQCRLYWGFWRFACVTRVRVVTDRKREFRPGFIGLVTHGHLRRQVTAIASERHRRDSHGLCGDGDRDGCRAVPVGESIPGR